jgi:uncharacterized membrane protein (DUF373 family)
MRDLKHFLGWMDKLDRWGYVTAGFSLLVLGMLIFAHSWLVFAQSAMKLGLLAAGLKLLNDLLLVIILLELFRTVVRFLQTEVLSLEPYLAVGIIACTRRILTAGAELGHMPEVSHEMFMRYLADVGVNVAVILVLIVAVFLVRKRPVQPIPANPAPPPS